MGKRKQSDAWLFWVSWLIAGLAIWLASAILVSLYLDRLPDTAGGRACAASCVYVATLLAVTAIGDFARVRTLLVLQTLYGVGVLVRSAFGAAYALLFLESEGKSWLNALDVLVRPLRGMEYVASQLTAHFVTEIYWLGLGFGATILVFLACVARMAAGNRIARARERMRNPQEPAPRKDKRRPVREKQKK